MQITHFRIGTQKYNYHTYSTYLQILGISTNSNFWAKSALQENSPLHIQEVKKTFEEKLHLKYGHQFIILNSPYHYFSDLQTVFEDALEMGKKTVSDLQTVFEDALEMGKKTVHRGRLNFYGYQEAGKSSLFKRLLRHPFDPEIERTKGIALQTVKVDEKYWREAMLMLTKL